MGKRGPAPKGEYAGQTAVLSTRITPELRARLEEAVERTGKTLSREIEHRLRRSFLEEEKIADTFGSNRDYAIMRMLAAQIAPMVNLQKPGADWTKDPYLFDQVVKSMATSLELIRPEGVVPEKTSGLDHGGNRQGEIRAVELLRSVRLADPGIPLSLADDEGRLVARLKDDLGEIADRIRVPYRAFVEAEPEERLKTGSRKTGASGSRKRAKASPK